MAQQRKSMMGIANSQPIICLFGDWSVWFRSTLVCVLAMVIAAPLHAGANAKDAESTADSDAMVAFLVQGYSANRDKFREFECHFHVTQGNATSVEDAQAGRLTDDRKMSGIWMVHGDWQRYELECEPRLQQRPKYDPALDPNRTLINHISCDPVKVMTDGGLGLSYSWVLEAASVAPSRGQRPPIYYTPISMSVMGDNEEWGPNAPLRPIQGGTMFRDYGGKVLVDDQNYEAVRVGRKVGNQFVSARHWLLDPLRGYLPIEMRYYLGDEQKGRTIATDVRQLENGGYFPYRTVDISPAYANDVRRVVIIEVDTFDLGPPPESAFTVSLPAGTMITNPDTNRGSFTFREATEVNIKQLSEVHARTETPRPEKPAAEKLDSPNSAKAIPARDNLPPDRPDAMSALWGWALLVAGGVAVLLVATLLVLQRRSNRK